MTTSKATVAVISIGQMGLGVASLLQAHDYHVITNVSDRSQATQDRAKKANLTLVASDEELVQQADYVLSIVPPRDAVTTAKRIETALSKTKRDGELYYLDLNAVSPSTVKAIYESFTKNAPSVRFIDGGIIGGPPSLSNDSKWTKPGIPLSGSYPLHSAVKSGANLAEVLNTRYLGDQVGSASGLKCCFAALSKGFTALAIQSYTTASSLGVYDALQDYLAIYNPSAGDKARKSVVACTSKAYRWVEEMNQIGEAFANEGGFKEQAQVFRQIAEVYQGLADVVEKEGANVGGTTEEVCDALLKAHGVQK